MKPAEAPPAPTTSQPTLSFENTAQAFAYKTDEELQRARLLFRSLKLPYAASMGPLFVRWALAWHLPIKGLLDTYFFQQFCGGKTLDDTVTRSEQLASFGVFSVLDYAVEAQKSDAGYQRATDELHRVIEHAKKRPEVAFIALKMSGLGNLELLAKRQASGTLSATETVQYDRMVARLHKVCAYAAEQGQSVMIDAEESWIQAEIDALAESMIFRYNTHRPVVYTTAQLYRHDRLAYVQSLVQRAAEAGVIAGIKLVRGAYLEKENDRAKAKGYPTPMQPTKAATDRDFDAAASYCVENLAHVAVCVGTHNEASCLALAAQMHRLGLPPNHPHVVFAQLFGMSDHISFNLAAAGYRAGKYLPYGPLQEVLPYLFRRAEENSSIAGQTPRELMLVESELRRRRQALHG